MGICVCLWLMTTTVFSQDKSQTRLEINLPSQYAWTEQVYSDDDFWSATYSGTIAGESEQLIQIQLSRMPLEPGVTPQKIVTQTTDLILTFDETAKLKLHRQEIVDGDECSFYSISTGKSNLLVFFRQSGHALHSIEVELFKDDRQAMDLKECEKLFFSSRLVQAADLES